MTPIDASTQPQPSTSSERPRFRTTAREFANPVDYQHPHPSMAQFADWKPKTIRQTVAATRLFFVDLLHHRDWTLFSQIRARDHDTLPGVLTRQQVHRLLERIRLRRYRTPLKLIYCCGLRLSECLGRA